MRLRERSLGIRSGATRLLRAVRSACLQGDATAILAGARRNAKKWSGDFLLDRLKARAAIRELAALPIDLTHERTLELAFTLGSGLIRPAQLPAELLWLLTFVFREPRPRFVMEIGTFRGGTLFCACRLAASDACVISLDLPGGPFGAGYPAWKRRLYGAFAKPQQSLRLIRGNSHSPGSVAEVRQILEQDRLDFLFIDGDHSYIGVKRDFEAYMPLVRTGGLVAFHDVIANPRSPTIEVYRFWEEIKGAYEHWEFIAQRDRGYMGIGVLRIGSRR